MANICTFEMEIKGKKENVENFIKAMRQEGNFCMGRGAYFEDDDYDEYICENGEINRHYNYCECKWSVQKALFDDAISMRAEPNKWVHDKDMTLVQFITLDEASKIFDIDVEIYSREEGCQFQEHLLIRKGEIECIEDTDWFEICKLDFETKEEAEDEYNVEITDEQWNNYDDYVSIGGYDWDFEL